MRDKITLFELYDVSTFFQYLYLSSNNRIKFNNGITELELSMDDNLNVSALNLSYPDLPPLNYNDHMCPPQVLGIIEILKKTPPVHKDWNFTNRWDELKSETVSNLSLNKFNFRK